MRFGSRSGLAFSKAGLVLAGALHALLANAQVQSISFEEAVRLALERNSHLQQARIESELAQVEVREARSQFMPELWIGAAGQRSTGRDFNETEGRVLEEATEAVSLGASSRLTLFRGFHDVANLNRAEHAREAAGLELARFEESVVFAVADRFLSLSIWQAQAHLQRDNLAGEVELEQQIKDYVDAGARAVADLYQQQANVAAARVAVIEAQAEAELAAIEIMRTLRLDPAGTYDFQSPARQDPVGSVDLGALLRRAFETRADVHSTDERVAAAEQRVRMARAGHWPTLTLDAAYDSEYADVSNGRFTDQLERERGGVVSLNFSIPLFDRNTVRHASRRAQLQALSAQVAREEVRAEVGLQVRQAYLNYQAARERFAAAQAQQQAAERAVQTAQERFRGGAYTLVELSDARADFTAARGAFARAQALLSFQRMALDYVVGDLDPARYEPE